MSTSPVVGQACVEPQFDEIVSGDAVDDADGFIGREAETGRVLEHLTDSPVGRGRMVLIRGESGIGKSRFLAFAVTAGRARGWQVLTASADRFERYVPYAVVGHAVNSFKGGGQSIAKLAASFTSVVDIAACQPFATVRRSALSLFAALRARGPVLLAVDDLTLADEDSIAVISILLRQQAPHSLLLIGTARRPDTASGGAFASLADRWEQDERVDKVDLDPLSRAEVAELIAQTVRRRPDAGLVTAINAASRGNPLFTKQMTLGLLETGAVDLDDTTCWKVAELTPLPSDRRSALLLRVMHVGEAATDLARVIALMGSLHLARLPFAAVLAGLDPADAQPAFDALVASGILRSTDDGTYGFEHSLVQESLYEDIGPAQRWLWHRQVAEWLRTRPQVPAVVLELATHVHQTAEFGDEEAITALQDAARITSTAAPGASLPWHERAIAITPEGHSSLGEMTADYAQALFLSGHTSDAIAAGRKALERLARGSTRDRTASLVVRALYEIDAIAEAAVFADKANLSGKDLNLLAQRSLLLAGIGEVDAAHEIAARIERMLPAASPAEHVHALIHIARVRQLSGQAESLGDLWEQIQSAMRTAPLASQLSGYVSISAMQAHHGDTYGARRSIARAQSLLDASGWVQYRAELTRARVGYAFHVGEWNEAVALCNALAEEVDVSGVLTQLDGIRILEIEIASHRGDWTSARQLADGRRQPVNATSRSLQAWAAAGLDLLTGNLDAARDTLDRALCDKVTTPSARSLLLARLAQVELQAANASAAIDAVNQIRTCNLAGLPHGTVIACKLAEGAVLNDIGCLTEALTIATSHEMLPSEAMACLALGEHGVSPEHNLVRAYKIFHGLDAQPWRRRAAAELRARSIPVPRFHANRKLLTDTETQVALLIQQGKANRDIATSLYLSGKTVETYVSRIFAKTGCSSRLELARRLDSGAIPLDR